MSCVSVVCGRKLEIFLGSYRSLAEIVACLSDVCCSSDPGRGGKLHYGVDNNFVGRLILNPRSLAEAMPARVRSLISASKRPLAVLVSIVSDSE